MNHTNLPHPILLAALCALLLTVLGCGSRTPRGKVTELFISNQRHNVDPEASKVRLYGRLENTGAGHFDKVEVNAVLHCANGDKCGENSVYLENLQPGEKRNFSFTVNSLDRVADVELQARLTEPE